MRNDGLLGEQVAAQILKQKTGGIYRSIHNGSGNGPDLVRINAETRTIEHIEVKSSQTDRPGWPAGNGTTRFNAWINEAAQSGKAISVSDRAFARDMQDKLANGGYTLVNKVLQVTIPPSNTSGTPIALLSAW